LSLHGEKKAKCFLKMRVLAGKPERDRLERPRHIWEDNIEVNSWSELIWLRIRPVANSCGHDNEPSGSTKCREFE
jgi:hypothetical protein